MSEDGRYLFAVTRGLPSDGLAGTNGIDGAPLDLLDCESLQAVVCRVDLREFGEAGLRRNLEDLAWVEKVARTHDDVVRAVASRSVVAPMRLVIVYQDDESLRDHVAGIHSQLVSALDRVEGRDEWSLKVYRSTTVASSSFSGGESVTGAAYLQHKRDEAAARRTAEEEAARAVQAIHDDVAARAVASRTLAPQDARLSGRTEPMLLNGAYLVDAHDADAFRAAAQAAGAAHPDLRVEVQGPWPPYSFAVLET